MKLTLGVSIPIAERIVFIKESIPFFNISKITIENSTIEDCINIANEDRKTALMIIDSIDLSTNLNIDLGNDAALTIVLWR